MSGPDEIASSGADGERGARSAHAGIDDREMHRAQLETAAGSLRDREPAALDILGRDIVRDVDQLDVRRESSDITPFISPT